MAERQKHGFDFEEYVETNYGNVVLSGEYGSRWDGTVRSYSGVEYPLSLKTCKNTSAIPLSDVFRNASVDEDFVLTVGFWKDVRTKKPASIHSVFVEHQVWHTFFDHETLRLLKERDIYDGIGNSRSPEWKKRKNWLLSTWDSEIIKINPKVPNVSIGRLGRTQCSIDNKYFRQVLLKDYEINLSRF